MEVFKRFKNDPSGQRGRIVGSVTTRTPKLIQVADGLKIVGILNAEQAQIRVEMFKSSDCQSDYSCQIRGVDSQGRQLSSNVKLTQQGQQTRWDLGGDGSLMATMTVQLFSLVQQMETQLSLLAKSLEDRDRRNEDKLEQLGSSVHGVTDSLNNVLLEHRINNRLNSFQNKIDELDAGNKVLTESASLLGNISREMVRIALSSAKGKGKDASSDVSEGCREFGEVLANTSTALLGSMNSRLGQIRDSAQENQLTITKQIKSLDESVVSTNTLSLQALNTSSSSQLALLQKLNQIESNVQDNHEKIISVLKDIVSEVNPKVTTNLHSIMVDIFRPKVCEKGMVSVLSQGSFPYPVIYPSSQGIFRFPYLCDPVTDAGGWIVIQRRTTGSVDFHRNWADYRAGFGYLDDDFWLGNNNIHAITRTGTYELRVDLRYKGKSAFAHYSKFSVSDEMGIYTLRLGTYSGTAGDSLSPHHNNRAFSTFDKDNDGSRANCADYHKGGWWFGDCDSANLNGKWNGPKNQGVEWSGFVEGELSVDFSEMKIRKVG